jgi:catechol 2,3-dioxygenase-like lactoylglutathione lyase family enzyme
MLGSFLELSLQTPDIAASLEFYTKLGFAQAEVGETWSHPYAVVTDGRLCLGLHQLADCEDRLSFVRPELLKALPALERVGVEFEYRHLGNDEFNCIGWRDPTGLAIRLLEARTFSPGKRLAKTSSTCGYFLEIALPAVDLGAAKDYWERLGFVGLDELDASLPHIGCTSDTIDLGLYEPKSVRRPTLVFESEDPRALAAELRRLGIAAADRPAGLRRARAVMIVAPEGTPILVMPTSERPAATSGR